MPQQLEVLRRPALKAKTGYSAMQIWRLERDGKFPKRIQLGPNAVGWLAHEIDMWIAEKMATRDQEAASRKSDKVR